MATVPLSGTDIRFLSGIPFNSDYKNTRWFDTVTEQTNYFLAKTTVHSMADATFQKIEGKNLVSVNRKIDDLWGTNYIMFRNTSYNSKWFYAFVTKLEYKNSGNTWVHFEIDVFQTWCFEMNFKPSYVVREHCKLWNSDGTPVINTVDEGLHYGTEMDNVYTINYKPNNSYKWLVIITKTPLHTTDNLVKATVVGSPQPLGAYILPFKDDDTVPQVTITADSFTVIPTKPSQLLENIYVLDDSVNNVVSLYITDYTGIPINYSVDGEGTDTIEFPDNGNIVKAVQVGSGSNAFSCFYVQKVKDFDSFAESYVDKYYGYKTVKESKLLMYPYTQLILDDFKGNRQIYKNEYISSKDITIRVKGSLGVSNKTSYSITDYNYMNPDADPIHLADEHALINNEPNDIPIVTDLLSAYLQGNRNSLQNQRNSILWNGTMNFMGGLAGTAVTGATGNVAGAAMGVVGMVKGAGNDVLALQGMQAKKDDIANVPPQIAKMGSNTSYTLGNSYNGVYLIKKQIKDEYIRKLEDFFGMFGYKLNEVKVPNFHTRQYWNYVQTKNCNILASINNEDLQELKSIFDGGITLWHTDDVGNYSLNNEVI
jgi:hypothetical protein